MLVQLDVILEEAAGRGQLRRVLSMKLINHAQVILKVPSSYGTIRRETPLPLLFWLMMSCCRYAREVNERLAEELEQITKVEHTVRRGGKGG